MGKVADAHGATVLRDQLADHGVTTDKLDDAGLLGMTATGDRAEPHLPDDAPDRRRRAWQDCATAFEDAAEEARIAE